MTENSGQIVQFNITEAAIMSLSERFADPVVPADKAEYDILKARIKEVRDIRVAIDKERKKQTAAALAHQREVNKVGNGIIDRLKAIELPMKLCIAEVDEAEERRVRELEEAEEKRLNRIKLRIANIEAYGAVSIIDSIDDVKARLARVEELDVSVGFDEFAKKAADARAESLANLKLGIEKLEAAADLDRRTKEIEEREAKAAAKQAELDKEESDRLAKEKAKAAKEQAEELARLRKLEDEQEERERVAEIEAENKRRAALAPEKEKIMAYVQALREVPAPELESESGKAMMASITQDLVALLSDFESGADRL